MTANIASTHNTGHHSSRHAWTVWLLLGLTTLQILLVFAQAVFAGQFLSGNAAGLEMHEMLGTEVLTLVSMLQFVAAILVWRPGRRGALPILLTVVTFILIFMQIEWGFGGRLVLHVPNALAIFALQFLLLWVTRRHEPRRRVLSPT
jgi:hypothetical protein